MPVTVDGVRLWGAEESAAETQANVDVTSAPSQAPDEALLTSIETTGSASLSGRATGIRLTQESGYPSDPAAALAQWVQTFETLISPEQGEGWTVVDEERDRSINAVATDGNWTIQYGSPFEARWTLTLQRGEGVFTDAPRTPTTATPSASTTLGGTDLGSILEKRTELSMNVDVTPVAYSGPSAAVISPGGGVVRTVTISGQVAGSPTELRSFDDTMQSNLGENQSHTYQTGVPGTQHTVLVNGYSSTGTAGSPAVLDYSLTLTEGMTV